jgi:hypothetical protein
MKHPDKMKSWLKAGLKIGVSVANIVTDIQAGPAKAAASLLKGISVTLEEVEKARESPFRSSAWKSIHLGVLKADLARLVERHPNARELYRDRHERSVVVELPGCAHPIGFEIYESWVEGPFIPVDGDREQAHQALGRLLWEQHGGHMLLRVTSTGMLELRGDRLTEVLASKPANDLAAYLARYRVAGHRRAVLLHGEPGNGKSHMIRFAARELGGLTLRVRARDLPHAHNLALVLELLQPSALLLDDLDRVDAPSALLDLWEEIRASCEVLLATANDITAFDPATLRPGRFDRIMHVERIDEEVFARMTEHLDPEITERVRAFPPAYLAELLRRVEVDGSERALTDIEDLEDQREKARSLRADKDEMPRKG